MVNTLQTPKGYWVGAQTHWLLHWVSKLRPHPSSLPSSRDWVSEGHYTFQGFTLARPEYTCHQHADGNLAHMQLVALGTQAKSLSVWIPECWQGTSATCPQEASRRRRNKNYNSFRLDPRIPGMCIFWKQKAPAGWLLTQRRVWESTLIKLIHFYRNLEKLVFPKKWDFDWNLPIKTHFLPKTKMVRMVHTNSFYEISLGISDPKMEFLTKTHFLKKWPCSKFWEIVFLVGKKPLRGASTAKQRF